MSPRRIPDTKKDVWKKTVEVERSAYYWDGEAAIFPRKSPLTGKPTVVELFSGCGGTSTGFEMAGFEVVLGADIHKPSMETFTHNHKHAIGLLGDLGKIKSSLLRKLVNTDKIDVMIAGVPCQGFSLNNRKRHQDDKRNLLYKEYMRFVEELSPRVAILENVSGMRGTANGAFVKNIEKGFKKVGFCQVQVRMLCAADYGVPQLRRRLVFVATRDGDSFNWPAATHGLHTDKPYVTVGEAIGDLPRIASGQEASEYDRQPDNEYQKIMRMGSNTLLNHEAPSHPRETIDKIRSTRPGEPMYPKFKQRIRLHWDRPSPTQVSGGIRPQFQFGHPKMPRGLSLRERCRMQSFPDRFKIFGGLVQGRVQTGNAVPPLLAKAVAKEVMKTLNMPSDSSTPQYDNEARRSERNHQMA